ncbi:hypothetical protein [Blastomonas sp.]|uniref:hypothetical protein n=1 Tax=Blastomonas sp. TaxID=1909299 RepID=UPI0035939353
MDFRTTAYRSALRTLAIDNRQCLAGGKMQSAGILFAAGMAERLLETRFAPARDTLVRAADSVAPEPRNASDALAICVVRTAPADVAGLFESDVAGEQEMAMAKALTPTVNRCAGSGLSPVMSTSGLRAILATAALRVVAAGAEQAG